MSPPPDVEALEAVVPDGGAFGASSPRGGGEETKQLRSRLRTSVSALAADHVCEGCEICGGRGSCSPGRRGCSREPFSTLFEGEPDPEPKTPHDLQEPPPRSPQKALPIEPQIEPELPDAQKPQLPKLDVKKADTSGESAPSSRLAAASPARPAKDVHFEPAPPLRPYALKTADAPKKKKVDGIARMVARLSLSAEKYGVVKRSAPAVRLRPVAPPQPPRRSTAVLAKQLPAFRRIAPVEPTPLWAPTKGLKGVADLLRAAKDERAPRVYGFRDLQKSDPGPGMPLALVANAWADRCDDDGRIQGRPLVVAVAYGVDRESGLALAPALGAYGAKAFAGEVPLLLDADLDVAESAEVVFSFAGVGAAPSPCATHICYVLPDDGCFCVVRNLVGASSAVVAGAAAATRAPAQPAAQPAVQPAARPDLQPGA